MSLQALPVLLFAALASATIFGNVRGIVHDPQHRPIEGAHVVIRARGSGWSQQVDTNPDGEFEFNAVPVGQYQVTISASGFHATEAEINVASGTAPILHFPLQLEAVKQTVEVSAAPEAMGLQSSASTTTVSRE